MDSAYYEMVQALMEALDSPALGLTEGTVISWPSEDHPNAAKRVQAAGLTQDEDSLLRAGSLGEDLAAGDRVLLAPLEEGQRYVILCKVVAV